jgi:hypothetical protein
MTAKRTAGSRATSGTKPSTARPRRFSGSIAMRVRSDGEIVWGITLASGFSSSEVPSTPSVFGGASTCFQMPQGCEPVVQIQVQLQSPSNPGSPSSQAALRAILNALQNQLDSDNEISETGSMELQMLMDTRSKLLQTASAIAKSMADTNEAITVNIKQ